MAGPSSVFIALDLVKNPLLAGVMRQHPLPEDVLLLIRVAAGSEDALQQAASATGHRPEDLRQAATFYIREVMWQRDGDCYRALGVRPSAPQKELAENLRWLMKWLHPDRGASELNQRYAARVLKAWEHLKTPARRRLYDRSLAAAKPDTRRKSRSRRRRTAIPVLPRIESAKAGEQGRWFSGHQAFLIAAIAVATALAMLTRFSL